VCHVRAAPLCLPRGNTLGPQRDGQYLVRSHQGDLGLATPAARLGETRIMGNQLPRLNAATMMLALSILLLACGQRDRSGYADLVAFDALRANPQQYVGQYVCTEGVHVDAFELSGQAASAHATDGYLHLTEPVIWLEGADFRSREECIQTDAQPPFDSARSSSAAYSRSAGVIITGALRSTGPC
jgi:hypothetical protein